MKKVKFRDKEFLWRVADELRDSIARREAADPPIDVVYVAEVILKLDLIPLPDLFADQHIDAALSPDLSSILIDEAAYMGWETGNRWVEQRLRFSVAHELGHLFLHAEELSANAFSTIAEFRKWASGPAEFQNAEYQANEFAGRFLVPRLLLLGEFDRYVERVEEADPAWREIPGMRSHLAEKMAPRFGVNRQVVETRFDREGLWPTE